MSRRRNCKKFNIEPPFYWPLILLLVIMFEIGVLVKERTWSQKYAVTISNLRDQVEKIDTENKLMFHMLYDLYSFISKNFENTSSTFLTTPERKIIFKNEKITTLGAINEEKFRY